MLIEFSVANFRSIRERVTLSMLATDEDGLEKNVMRPQGLLKSAVIYGANASGKSNVLKAMEFMMEFVRESHHVQKGDLIPVSSFRLDRKFEGKPSEFEVLFVYDGMKYAYGFKVDREMVHEEYLYEYPGDVQTLIFERTGTVDFEFGVDEEEQAILSKRTLENGLYLSTATQFNYEKTLKVFEWIKSRVECWIGTEEMSPHDTRSMFVENEEVRELVKRFLVNADIGIMDIKINKTEGSLIGWHTVDGRSVRRPIRRASKYQIKLYHAGVHEAHEFKLEEESEGTQRLFNMLGPWIKVLLSGNLLIVDELEKSLHPLIVEQLVKLFHDPRHNPRGAQLIFSTHNTNLLDDSLFGRDQIWFTEKGPSQGNTGLYSLAEFTPRESEDIEKGYLLGRYGAIPFFGKEFLF